MIGEAIFKHVGTTSVIALYLVPQTFYIKKYRQFRARYGFDDNELPVHKEIQQRFEEVLNDINLPEAKRERIELFNVHDTDVFHAGTTYSKYGAIIGVPPNYEYKDISNIRDETISFEYKQIDWNTPTAKEFKRSLILSENAQKFALALKVLTVGRPDLICNALILVLDMWLAVAMYNVFVMQFPNTLNIVRIALLGACITGFYIWWLFTSAALKLYTDGEINAQIIDLGSQYIEGGAEYYEKLLNRNKALRDLLGDRGTYLFTSAGNEFFWLKRKGMTISEQVDFFKSQLSNVQSG